jgi:hypothetical protein
MFASIPKSYQVDLTSWARLTFPAFDAVGEFKKFEILLP